MIHKVTDEERRLSEQIDEQGAQLAAWRDRAIAAEAEVARLRAVEEMDAVAIKYAHKLALDLECILGADYGGTWYDSAMQTISGYRMEMNAIHERESPTHMGEPLIAPPAQPAEPVQPQWLPIESAPKDGTHVLLWCPTNIHKGVQAMPFTGRYMSNVPWIIVNADMAIQKVHPTHWMPLPPAPKATK